MAVQGSKKRYGCEYHATFDIVELKLAGKHCTRISSSSYDKHLIEGQSGIDRPTDQLDYFWALCWQNWQDKKRARMISTLFSIFLLAGAANAGFRCRWVLTSVRCILNNFNSVPAQVHLWQLGVHSGLRGSWSDFRQIIFTWYKRKRLQAVKKEEVTQPTTLNHYPDKSARHCCG